MRYGNSGKPFMSLYSFRHLSVYFQLNGAFLEDVQFLYSVDLPVV